MNTFSVMTNTAAPWYRHRWPWLLMLGPVSVLIAGAITAWISFSGADALVVDDYYKQGKAINQDLRRDQAALARGLQLALTYDPREGRIIGRLQGEFIRTPMRLTLVHPTVPAKDQRRTVTPDERGVFSVPLPMFERARWQVQLEDGSGERRLHGDWAWPAQKKTDIQPALAQGRNASGGR